MTGENIQDQQTVFDSAACRNLVAEHCFLAIVMQARIEIKLSGVSVQVRAAAHLLERGAAIAARVYNRPAREAARNLLHVLLCVAAVNAKRMQFH
jgi:hypothetical protein